MSRTLSQPPRRSLPEGKITFEQFLDWLEENVHAEWVDGEVRVMSPVSFQHAQLVGFLQAMLWGFVERKGAGVVLAEPFLVKLPDDLPAYSPDIFYLSADRQDLLRTNFLDGAPDLVVEVISPESRARDRGEKFENYEKAGVQEYWLIDSERRRAEFYALGEDGLYESIQPDAEGVVHSRVLAGVWVKPEWFWQKPLPSLLSVLQEWGLLGEER